MSARSHKASSCRFVVVVVVVVILNIPHDVVAMINGSVRHFVRLRLGQREGCFRRHLQSGRAF